MRCDRPLRYATTVKTGFLQRSQPKAGIFLVYLLGSLLALQNLPFPQTLTIRTLMLDNASNQPVLPPEIDRRRTFAIISHPDAGKTTLTEKFLLYGGAIQDFLLPIVGGTS